MTNNILIIGGPNAGKTHFGGQLYGRLNSRKFNYRIDPNNRPSDLTIFEDVLNKLSEGVRAEHTEASANRSIELKISDEHGNNILLAFPDYAGEQVRMIVETRRVNPIWQEYIQKSNTWILFVRLDEVAALEDIVNRGIPSPEELQRRKAEPPPVKITDAAQFVELLQILLYIKEVSSWQKIKKPKLCILLSCWDILNQPDDTIPAVLLRERIPLLYSFVTNSWEKESLSVLGLSSTEKTLSDQPDEDYIDKTPINFGYFITANGKKEKDLTLSISEFLEQ